MTVGVFIQPLEQYRGFSSFKFLPGTRDSVIIATKSEENKGRIVTCILICMCVKGTKGGGGGGASI